MQNQQKYKYKQNFEHNFDGFLIEAAVEESLRILLVDDDQSFLRVSKIILEMENNFEIDAATSVDEALNKMKTKTYDAVVSDYEMPIKNGEDFLNQLRQQKNDIPFISFSFWDIEEAAFRTSNVHADQYIHKNGSPGVVYRELAKAICKTVERKKAKALLVESEAKY